MRYTTLAVLLCNVIGLTGCTQHDLFHPGSISSGVAASHLVKKVMPVYPAIARQEHVSGAMVVSIVIDEQGNVTEVTPISGPALLLPEFVEAVKQWKYKPFEQDGVPVTMHTTVTLTTSWGG